MEVYWDVYLLHVYAYWDVYTNKYVMRPYRFTVQFFYKDEPFVFRRTVYTYRRLRSLKWSIGHDKRDIYFIHLKKNVYAQQLIS